MYVSNLPPYVTTTTVTTTTATTAAAARFDICSIISIFVHLLAGYLHVC